MALAAAAAVNELQTQRERVEGGRTIKSKEPSLFPRNELTRHLEMLNFNVELRNNSRVAQVGKYKLK